MAQSASRARATVHLARAVGSRARWNHDGNESLRRMVVNNLLRIDRRVDVVVNLEGMACSQRDAFSTTCGLDVPKLHVDVFGNHVAADQLRFIPIRPGPHVVVSIVGVAQLVAGDDRAGTDNLGRLLSGYPIGLSFGRCPIDRWWISR